MLNKMLSVIDKECGANIRRNMQQISLVMHDSGNNNSESVCFATH